MSRHPSHSMFRALRHPNFRLFYLGQSMSLIGSWMQTVALSWLVYRLTESAFLLGCVGFASQIPAFLLSPVAGIVADRFDRRRVLLIVQVLSMAQAAVLTFLFFTNAVNVTNILALSFFLGLVMAFDLPVRQSFIVDMIDRDKRDLGNAVALHSSLFNGSRLIGPAIAGVLMAAFGEGICFLVNTLSYLPVIIALLMMRMKAAAPAAEGLPGSGGLRQGLNYAWEFLPIRTLLLLLCVISFLIGGVQTLVPVMVKQVYLGGPKELGYMVSMSGVGAFLATIYLAQRQSVVGLGRKVGYAALMFSAALAVFGFVSNGTIAGFLALVMGLAMIMAIGSTNMVLQTVVEEDKRGRVMSLYGAALIGMTPVGSLLAGYAAGTIGLSWTFLISGLLCLAAVVAYWKTYRIFRPLLRAVYIQKGIITET